MKNSTTTSPVITDDVMTSTATPHYATRCPKGWAVTWLGNRTVDRNQAVTAMMIAVEIATKDLDTDQVARWLIDDLAGELDLGMFEAIAMVTGIEATRDLPGFVGDALDQGREDEYEAQLEAERAAEPAEVNASAWWARIERAMSGAEAERAADIMAWTEQIMARIEPSGPQGLRTFMVLVDFVLTGNEPLFLAEELVDLIGQLIRGEWRPVAEALAARNLLAEIEIREPLTNLHTPKGPTS